MRTRVKTIATVGTVMLMVLAVILAVGVPGQKVRGEHESKEPANGGKWEYLVISGGNVNLQSLSSEEFSNQRKQPDGSFQENPVLERNLDKLGARGWELVSVYGQPNNPIYYFKRLKEAR